MGSLSDIVNVTVVPINDTNSIGPYYANNQVYFFYINPSGRKVVALSNPDMDIFNWNFNQSMTPITTDRSIWLFNCAEYKIGGTHFIYVLFLGSSGGGFNGGLYKFDFSTDTWSLSYNLSSFFSS